MRAPNKSDIGESGKCLPLFAFRAPRPARVGAVRRGSHYAHLGAAGAQASGRAGARPHARGSRLDVHTELFVYVGASRRSCRFLSPWEPLLGPIWAGGGGWGGLTLILYTTRVLMLFCLCVALQLLAAGSNAVWSVCSCSCLLRDSYAVWSLCCLAAARCGALMIFGLCMALQVFPVGF